MDQLRYWRTPNKQAREISMGTLKAVRNGQKCIQLSDTKMDSVSRVTFQRRMVQSIHTFNKDLSRVCCLSGTVLASGNTEMNTTNKISVPVENQLLSHSLHTCLFAHTIFKALDWHGWCLPGSTRPSFIQLLSLTAALATHDPPPPVYEEKNTELFLSFN